MNGHATGRPPQRGFGLLELMVAIAISLLLFAGVLNIFLSSKQTYRGQSSLSRLQERGRAAIDFLNRDIRMAGYSGCQRIPSSKVSNTLQQNTTVNYKFKVAVDAYDPLSGGVPSYLTTAGINPLPNTDVLIVRGPTGPSVPVIKNNDSAQLFSAVTSQEPGACSDGTDRISGICQSDILMITDCQKARVFQAGPLTVAAATLNITHPASGSPGNDPSAWGGASAPPEERFGTGSEIVATATRVYYLATGANGRPSLFRTNSAGAAQELVEGVEDMQLEYGVDTNADRLVDGYLSANLVTDWENVVSVRVNILLQSTEPNVNITPAAVYFNGATRNFTDRRLRHAFVSTVGIRNRLP